MTSNQLLIPEIRNEKFQRELVELKDAISKLSSDALYDARTDELKKRALDLEVELCCLNSKLVYLSFQINRFLTTSFDGLFFWKVDNFQERKKSIIENYQKYFFSPSFYSHPYGYKVTLRLYLNGDGVAKGNNLSIYMSLLKGEFDEILKWPFSYVVCYVLFNRNKHLNHMKFVRSSNGKAFQKPEHVNKSVGCSNFIRLDQLEKPDAGFIMNDCLYFHVSFFENESYIPKFVTWLQSSGQFSFNSFINL